MSSQYWANLSYNSVYNIITTYTCLVRPASIWNTRVLSLCWRYWRAFANRTWQSHKWQFIWNWHFTCHYSIFVTQFNLTVTSYAFGIINWANDFHVINQFEFNQKSKAIRKCPIFLTSGLLFSKFSPGYKDTYTLRLNDIFSQLYFFLYAFLLNLTHCTKHFEWNNVLFEYTVFVRTHNI